MTGEAPAVTPPVSGNGAGADEEVRKKLFAMLRDGHRVVVWDNQQAPLGSPALDAFLTGATYSDRVLGLSESGTLSNSSLFLVTGNNLRLVGDTCRRIVVARLDAEVERPFTRSFDFCPLQTVIARRAALVQAALTILRGWITAGRPRHGTGRTASFEDWDDTVRQPICWLAEMDPERWADPVGALLTATEHDPEAGKLGALLHAWHAVCGDAWVTTAELANECEGTVINLAGGNARADLEAAIDEIAGDRGGLNRRILGRWIERNVDKRCDGYRIERSTVVHRGSPRWRARAA